MKRIRRTIAAILAAVLTYGVFFGITAPSFAAAVPVNVYVDKFAGGKLDIHWDQVPGTQSVEIIYHIPNLTDDPLPKTDKYNLVTNSARLSSVLKADYIYDIEVRIYDAIDGSGNMIGKGFIYYLPQITFSSRVIEVPSEEISGGGRQSGNYPRLELKWKIPKVYNEANKFVMADAVLSNMEQRLNAIYDDGRNLDTLNYRINISSNINLLNSGSAQTAVLINNNGGVYKANLSGGDPADAAQADQLKDQLGNPTDYMGFELWGHSDAASSTDYLTQDEKADPAFSAPNALKDADILPGSVYYMNIKPVFKNTAGQIVSAVTVGNPEDQNGSMLTGLTQYAYTPIRFQLTKDSSNNIYIKIYKINQGSLDLPRLFYEVQASDDPSIPGDWEVKKTMDDSYFNGNFAVTVISGVNPNNEIYYKIAVKSDSPNDRLESLKMPYTLKDDSNRPPLPTNIIITNKGLNTGNVTVADPNAPNDPTKSLTIKVKSTNVEISWDKPLGWDDTAYDKNKVYFHFMLSTSQTDLNTPVQLFADDTNTSVRTPLGEFTPKFRLVRYINGGNSKIVAAGNRLYLTLDGINDLFTWDNSASSGKIPNTEGNPSIGYPDFLIPNTVYYLQMYTTTAAGAGTQQADQMSDKSIITSFTTLNGEELDVPLPMSFGLDANGKVSNPPPAMPPVVNYVDLKFDKVMNLDWNNYTNIYDPAVYKYNIYYDVFASLRSDTSSFIQIGTTEKPNGVGDIAFTGADDPASTSIKARVSTFKDQDSVDLFGSSLMPNTTYYFKVRTRLKFTQIDGTHEKNSIDTAILPVTTIVINVNPPDDSRRKPMAPTDFAIAEDSNGNLLLSGSSVTFTWQRQENDVVYQLVRTRQKVNPTDDLLAYQNDPEYSSFLGAYDVPSDGVENDLIYLDPDPVTGQPPTDPGKFIYDSATKTCTYTVDRRMFPNKLYYFSLKTVRITRTPTGYTTTPAESVWVSIPVTTSLIQPPSMLEAVNTAELGFFWTDNTPGMTAEDFSIYMKDPDDADFKLMNRSQSTIVKDGNGQTYYGRILGLKTNSSYDIRVFKGGGASGTLVFEKAGMQTRDGYHELEIKWIGNPVDDFSKYEIAIMAEGSSDYIVLTGNDLEYYSDKNGKLLPYYTEETPQTINNNSLYFHARIKQVQVELPGGLVTHQPLHSNVKYYMKVRAVKVDPADTALISYSKYVGPVNSRTEFNQDDYDNTDREEKQKAIFLDRMKQLEQGYYWRIAVSNSTADRILLKGDRVVNALQSLPGSTFTVDLTAINVNMDKDEVYVPVSVVRAMNSLDKSLLIKTPGAEFLLRPDTLDASGNKQIKELLAKPAVKDLYLRLIATRSDIAPAGFPSTGERVSRINDLEVQAIGSSRTDGELKKLFYDKLYDKDTGLVGEKLNILQNTYTGTGSDAAKLMDEYTGKLIEVIENELSIYIDNTIESIKLPSATQNIIEFASPVSASLTVGDKQGTKVPYVLYDGTTAWQKIVNNTQQAGRVTMNVLKTGKYTVLVMQGAMKGVPDGYWAKDQIAKLTSKYDLTDVFSGTETSFMPDNKATCREIVLLYEKVTGRTSANTGLDVKQKSQKLGLDAIINPNGIMKNVKRQETAAVLLKLFAVKKGVSADSLRPGGNISINDEADIDGLYYNSVLMIVDMGVMNTDSDGNFLPAGNMTRAEVSVAFVRMLELTGDL